jgi:predicted oxidoreductase (fatty acid repression mutant protein)
MNIYEAMEHRRSRYALDANTTVSDERIEEIVGECLVQTPSAFNSQTARVVALFGESHEKLWSIVMETLRARVPADKFAGTEAKVNGFAAAHATLLFFEETDTVKALQEQFPAYADNFPLWSLQASGMAQVNVWTALSSEGLGVNLQHYNPIIDDEVARTFGVPASWKLISQMVVGNPIAEPGPIAKKPVSERLVVRR